MEDGKVIISIEEYNRLKDIEKSKTAENLKELEFRHRLLQKSFNQLSREASSMESHYEELLQGKDSVYTENRELKLKITEYEKKLKKYRLFVSNIKKSFFKSLFINTKNLPN